MKIEIIYEDENIIVLNKPSGLVVNRSRTHRSETLQDYLEKNVKLRGLSEEFIARSGLAHRIDKDTSGIVVGGKDDISMKRLLKQFKRRQVEKEYIALIHNRLSQDNIEINAPIGRNPKSYLKFAIVASGRPSITKIEKIKETEINKLLYTLIRVYPKTGRTHQIRVHLSALGNFIAHDEMYCTKKLLVIDRELFNRMMLHAYRISFTHPISGKIVEYKAKIPDDFKV